MADDKNRETERLVSTLMTTYIEYAEACARLSPLPIGLPVAEVMTDTEIVTALARIIDTAEEIPLPDEPKSLVFTVATRLYTAFDLLAILQGDGYSTTRLKVAVTHVVHAHVTTQDLAQWLTLNGD